MKISKNQLYAKFIFKVLLQTNLSNTNFNAFNNYYHIIN